MDPESVETLLHVRLLTNEIQHETERQAQLSEEMVARCVE